MKSIAIVFVGLTVFLFSCKPSITSETEDTATQVPPAPAPERLQQPVSKQYCFYTSNDTAVLTLELAGSEVSGTYMTHHPGQEKTNGKLENGVVSGDTIYANYRFIKNGTESIRDVAFLVQNHTVTEGIGKTTLQNGKQAFADKSTLTFDASRKMTTQNCEK